MSWHVINLTDEQIEFGFADILKDELAETWLSGAGQPGFSVWLTAENPKKIYLSPVAAQAARALLFRFGGKPCRDPDLTRLEFMLGTAWRDDVAGPDDPTR